jgi:hypothetical protein
MISGMPSDKVPEPWRSLLADIDAQCDQPIEMHCIGGFAVTLHYGFMRPTGDIDVWHVIPTDAAPWLAKIAGKGSELHRKHRVYVQVSAVATVPEDYESRLVEVFPGEFEKLRILVLDPYDLALSKLERNAEIDVEDVKHLARAANFDLDLFADRYRKELRPFVTGPEAKHDLTFELWIDAIKEERARSKT